MELRTRIFVITLSVIALIMVVNFVRTRRLKEEFALLWLGAGILLVAIPVFVDVVDAISYMLGIEYPPALIFLVALLAILGILLQFSMTISRYSDQIKVLTQEVALLTQRVRELEAKVGETTS
jgi:hypothetical protein